MQTKSGSVTTALPAGVVTFLLTDVEGSGKHWAADGDAMRAATRALDDDVSRVVGRHGGTIIKPRGEGDSHFAVFTRPSRAVLAACDLQATLRERSGSARALRVRAAVHTGEITPVAGDYYGLPVVQAARLRALGHGGQVLVSPTAAHLAGPALPDDLRLRSLGLHKVRDFPRLEEVFQAEPAGRRDAFPPLVTDATRGPAILAVALVDICGARAALARVETTDTTEQRRWIAVLRRTSEAHDAVAVKLLGDGGLIGFEDPAAAVAFVRDLRTAVAGWRLEIRAGVALGRVELVEGEFVGRAQYAASALLHAAQPGQALVTAMVRDLAAVTDAVRVDVHHAEPAMQDVFQI
jgi:class 3 adenylate cyclase